MNVEELIELLQQQPPGSEVVVQSYEEGYDPVTDVNPISVQPLEEKPWYSGVYEKSEASGKEVVLIKSRYNRAGYCQKFYENYEKVNRLMRTATRTDYE